MTDDNSTNPLADNSGLTISSEEVKEKFADKMNQLNLSGRETETRAKAELLGLGYVQLGESAILPDHLGLIPEKEAQTAQLICFGREGDRLQLGLVDPNNAETQTVIAELKKRAYQPELYLISPHSFAKAFYFYKTVPKVKAVSYGVTISEDELKKFQGKFVNFKELAEKIRKISATDLVTLLVATALDGRASDIHIEAEEKGILVRYRIDGLLHEIVDLPKETWKKLISRIKLLARLKINVIDQPQDGSFSINLKDEHIDVRASTVPTNYGESVVLRLLMSSSAAIGFDDLGLSGKAYADLEREILKPNGMIITTGPTGSGKTTTLYAVLKRLNQPETKIITLEDPIEYKLPGVNQSQVKTNEGYTFAKGLRSILRQDPDVIMVGEIRDLDTAETAINAALTGHLVVSTLHTNSAAGTIPRLLSMEVKPFLLAPALLAMIGQRLVRRICPHCKVPAEIDSRTMSEVIQILSRLTPESGEASHIKDLNNLKFYQGKGCDQCQGLGYHDRVGIFEVITMIPEIEKMILANQASEFQIQELAMKHGLVTMLQDGLLKALDGITTVDEVFRVAK